ncbi:MAG: alpha-mannosidase [Halanaerobiales bacterium]
MFFTEEKLADRIKELNEFRYRNSIDIREFKCQEDEKGEVAKYPPEKGEWQTIKTGERWQGRDRYLWLAKDIEIPAGWKGNKVLGRFDFGTTGGGNNSGFESLLFLNGRPYKGVDSNHQEVFFPEEMTGNKISLRFRLWSGLEGGGDPQIMEHQIKLAEICCLDEITDDLFYTARAVLETVRQLEDNNPERSQLLAVLDRSFQKLDWSRPGSDKFYDSVQEANSLLNEELAAMEKNHPVTVHCIGHTHIDVAWLWRLKHTREKAARSFSTVLRLMEQFPEYYFLQSQPQLYEYIKNDYPEIYEQIKERIKDKKWEAEGGMWVEADCNISSGESLVRQLLYGKRFLKQEFDIDCKYLWLPDVFGYSWALPQILKKSGIETFMTTKISWNQYNEMPHDTFNWKGIDGTEILTHFITTPTHSRIYTYNGVITPESVKGIWENYNDKEINKDLLLSYGYGDGGGGVNREMLEMRRRLDDLPALPQVKTERAGEFFKKLHQQIENTDQYVHTWDGELYLEYHRGTYTSQAYNKKMNRKLELLYRETEWMQVLQGIEAEDMSVYTGDDLREGWKIILRNQFHDIIPGSSIREVYEDSKKEYAEAEKIADNAWQQAAEMVVKEAENNKFTVFNSSPWMRSDYVEIPVAETGEKGNWQDSQGKKLQAEKVDNSWLVQVEDIPSLGYTTIKFTSDSATEKEVPFNIEDNKLETPYYEIEWNQSGQLVKIYDKEADREVLDGNHGNVFQVFEDKPMAHDAWDIDIYYQQKMKKITDLKSVEVKEVNSLRAVINFKWEYMDSSISQDIIVYKDKKRIDYETEVDWHEHHQLLKVAFPVKIRATEATYDIQYGNVTRPNHWNTSWDYARFETVGHQWADLSEKGYGVSLLNDCKYGYDIKDNVMRLSLIKSATHPDYKQDQGQHLFTYSLLPHQGDWVEGDVVLSAWELNNPLYYKTGQAESDSFSLFQVDRENIMIDSVKKAEDKDEIVLRVHEYAGSRGKVNINGDIDIKSWQECNLMEEASGEVQESNTISFAIDPYEIKTFLIKV